jgi:signal transduction histidine kinase
MDRVRERIDDRHERTDASLHAERESGTVAAVEGVARRRLSDLIEHDRLLVDGRLLAFRDSADRLLARERLAAPSDTVSAFGDTKRPLSRERIERAHKQNVLAMVTHELRSPLAVISRSAEYLAGCGAVERASGEAVEDIRHSVARLTRLLSDLLDGARIDARTFRVVPVPNDVGALLSQIRASYTPLFEARQLSFTVESPEPGATPLVVFDRDRIVQVLSNLLSNAMKFVRAKGTVSLAVSWGDDCIEFVVCDDGPGIGHEALPHVFERFWQAGVESRDGLGLGLFICETIVHAHGGRIAVQSQPGSGATVRFTLPRSTPRCTTPYP